MLILSDSRKPERAMSDCQCQLFSTGTGSSSVKFCETLSKLCLTSSFTFASEKMFCAIGELNRFVMILEQPTEIYLCVSGSMPGDFGARI